MRRLISHNTNNLAFPNKHLTKHLKASSDKKKFIRDADVFFIASAIILYYRESKRFKTLLFKEDALFVNLSKGLFEGGRTIVERVKKELDTENVVALKGPSFAVEVMEHADTLLTLGYSHKRTI